MNSIFHRTPIALNKLFFRLHVQLLFAPQARWELVNDAPKITES